MPQDDAIVCVMYYRPLRSTAIALCAPLDQVVVTCVHDLDVANMKQTITLAKNLPKMPPILKHHNGAHHHSCKNLPQLPPILRAQTPRFESWVLQF